MAVGAWPAVELNLAKLSQMPPNARHLRKPISKSERCHSLAYSPGPSFIINIRMEMKFIMSSLFIHHEIGMANTPKSDINDEHTEWRWFSANEIPEDISPPIK